MAIATVRPKSAVPQDIDHIRPGIPQNGNDDDLVRLTGGTRIPWPKDVAIPSTLAEALADGWEVDGEQDIRGTEYLVTGMKDLVKYIGERELRIAVPYRARFNHGRPRKVHARRAELITRGEFFVRVEKRRSERTKGVAA